MTDPRRSLMARFAAAAVLAAALPLLAFNPPASGTDPNEGSDNSDRADCNTSGSGGAVNGCVSLRIPFGRVPHAPELSRGFLGLDFERASPLMHTPQGLAYRFFPFSSVTNAGVNDVTVVQANGDGVTFRFASGSSVAAPAKRETGFPNRLQRLTAGGAPVTDPASQTVAWYDHWYSDGSRVRLSAQTGKSDSVTTAAGRAVASADCGVTVVRDAAGVLRQVWSEADGLADIVVTASSAYEIRLYAPEAAGTPGAGGVRLVSGAPLTVWRISNPDAGAGLWSRLLAVEARGGLALTNEWRYIQARDEWVLDQSRPGGRRTLHDSEKSADGKSRTLTETTYGADGRTVARKRVTRYADYGWGLAERERVEDPGGAALTRTTEYWRDPSQAGRYAQPRTVTWPDGSWEAFDYDAQGRVTLKVSPWLGQPASPAGKTAAQLAETGLAVSYSYAPHDAADVPGIVDARPRTVETRVAGIPAARSYASYVRGGDGALTEFRETCADLSAGFGAASGLRTVVTRHPPSGLARVKSVLSPGGALRSFAYAAGDWSGSLADPGAAAFAENAAGKALMTAVTEGAPGQEDGIPGRSLRTVTYADARGNAALSVIQARSAAGFTNVAWEAAAYDAFHNPTSRVDSAGYASAATWAGGALPIASADGYGLSYAYRYDALGRLSEEVRLPAGGAPAVTNSFAYDPLDRLAEASVSSGGISRRLLAAAYDRAGRPASVTDGAGRTTSYAYADGGRTVTETPPGGGTLIHTLWPGGTPRSVTGTAAAPPVWYTYGIENGKFWTRATAGAENSPSHATRHADPAGRTVSIRYPDGLSESLAYDLAGRLTNALDRAGRATRLAWDPFGNPLSVWRQADAGFATVSFGLDLAAQAGSVTNEAGARVSLAVTDIPGRKVTDTDISGLDEVTRYAAGGRVASVSRRDGVLVSNVWDAAGRLAEVRHGGASVLGLAWRADGLLSAASNAAASVAWAYDAFGRAVSETAAVSNLQFQVSSSYDAAALATNTALSVGSWTLNVGRSFDPAGRLRSVGGAGGEFRIAYDGTNGLPAVVTNAAITCRYGYDLLGRLTNLTYATVGTSRVFRQWHDVSGAVTQRSVTVNNNALFRKWDLYAYDSLGRLSHAGKKSGFGQVFSNRFGYDPAGNRLSVSTGAWASAQFYTSAYAYADNRLVSVSTNGAFASAVLYDAAGNVTGMVSRAGVRLALAWNTQGQLVSVATNGAPAESYAYDPLGRRVRTASGTNVVFHVYDGDRCAADTDASGNPLRVYTWGPGIDDLLAVTAISGASTSTCYAVKDHLGSVCALVTAAGAVVASYTYDAWGNVSATINYSLLPVNFSCRFLFHGGWYSEATGLYQFRARWYSPELGRWLSPDPIGLEGGLNLYEFCGNNPVNNRDPSGLITVFVYDSDDTELGAYFQRAANNYERSYDMGLDSDLRGLRNYIENLRRNGDSIQTLMIADHGTLTDNRGSYQWYNDTPLELLPNAACDMNAIGEMLDPFALIKLLGCNVGIGEDYLKEMANAFNRTTMAYTAYVYWTSNGDFFPGFPDENNRGRRALFRRRYENPQQKPLWLRHDF